MNIHSDVEFQFLKMLLRISISKQLALPIPKKKETRSGIFMSRVKHTHENYRKVLLDWWEG